MPVVIGLVGIFLFALLSYAWFTRTRHSRRSADAWDQQWFEEFSAFRYLPMRRLLSGTEEAYAQHQQQGSKLSLRKFRAERRILYREYLRDLGRDFERLSMAAKLASLHATDDQSDQIAALVGLEWRFRKALLRAHIEVAMHAGGWDPDDATHLIDALQHLEFSIRETRLAHPG